MEITKDYLPEENMSNIKPRIKKHPKSLYVERHKSLCKELHETFKKKNADYKGSFHNTYKQFGITSAAIRISDKYNRMVGLINNNGVGNVHDESLRDTLLDLAGYALLTIMELDSEGFKHEK